MLCRHGNGIACLGCEVDLELAEKALADQKQMEECLACGGEGRLHSYSGDKKYNCPWCRHKGAVPWAERSKGSGKVVHQINQAFRDVMASTPKVAMMCSVFGRWAHTGKP